MYPGGTPTIVQSHASNERPRFGGHPRSTRTAWLRLPSPPASKAYFVPTDDGLGHHDDERIGPHRHFGPHATQKARSVSVSGGRGRSRFSTATCCRRAILSKTRSARRPARSRTAAKSILKTLTMSNCQPNASEGKVLRFRGGPIIVGDTS